MTTSAAPQDVARREAEIAARTRLAWSEYRKATEGSSGREYEDAEAMAWDVLQAELRLIETPETTPPA